MKNLVLFFLTSFYIFSNILYSCKDKDGELPVLLTLQISNITSISATCGGTITDEGSGSVNARGVCWSSNPSPTILDKFTTDGTGSGTFTSEITELQPATTYYVRSYATNSKGTSYGDQKSFTTESNSDQIIADHTIVADFDKIPASYLNEVKKMMVCFAGESHSAAYRTGMLLLEESNPSFSANESTGESYTDQYVRVNTNTSTGEANWYTWYAYPLASRPAAKDIIKNYITEYVNQSHPLSVLGFAWCYDMTIGDASSTADPIYGCHWAGASDGGPQGNRPWGLDADDASVTGNAVSLDTYLSATEDYIAYCNANGYPTKIVFTTGTVDEFPQERGYQGYLKNERIRNYVKSDPSRILFDYADILCYDNDGTLATETWNGHTYPYGTSTNVGDKSIGHIGPAGAIRLAKAQWWMLARIAGWEGVSHSDVPVTGISVTGQGGATSITTDNGTLQLSAAITPANATTKTVKWSVSNGTGQASISTSGLVTAIANGTVTAKAAATDGSGVFGTLLITISNQIIPVSGITVTGAGGVNSIASIGGTLQLNATLTPGNATTKTVKWSIANGTGQASISNAGLVTAIATGTVTAKATATDGSGVSGTLLITISKQIIPVTGVVVSGAGGATSITKIGGTLQLDATVLPSNATNKAVSWSISNGTGMASISSNGQITAIKEGTVTVMASATDESGVKGTLDITIKITESLSVIVENNEMRIYLNKNYTAGKLSLYNLQGLLVKSMLIDSDLCVFDISDLATGIYFVVLSKSEILIARKVIISV